MPDIEKSCEIAVSVRAAYDQWTQFEEFPRFMGSVESVRQIDDKNLHWRANLVGKAVEWNAEIIEQIPDRVISWRSTSGPRNEGSVLFEALRGDQCRVSLRLKVSPSTFGEKVGVAVGVTSARVGGDLDRFKKFIEARRLPTGQWRGEIHGDSVRRPF